MKSTTIAGLLAFCTLATVAAAQAPPTACETLAFATGEYTEVVSQRDTMLVNINERRDILGHWTEENPNLPDGFYAEAFVIRRGEHIPIAVPGAHWTLAVDMNAEGIVIGNFRDADQQLRAFRWKRGDFTILEVPDPDAYATFVEGINAAGVIVGRSYLYGGGLRGYVYRDGSYETVGDPPGWSGHSYAADIDNRGDVLVIGIDQTAAWYIRTRDALQPLPVCPTETAIDFADGGGFLSTVHLPEHEYGSVRSDKKVTLYQYPGAQYTYLWDVNAQGDAVGVAYDADWTRHVFLYTPRRD
jgi:hypothetical protein